MENYETLGVLGEGTYGVVVKARHRVTGQIVAIKKFKQAEADDHVRKTSLREVKVLKQLRHPNVISLVEVFRREGKLYLVFEYIENTILQLLEATVRGLDALAVKKYMYQLLRGVDYCHAHSVIHRDVKPENILVSQEGLLKVCDFGFARHTTARGKYTDYVATRWYRAPELLVGDVAYGRGVDVWAIGCILAELSDSQPLFPGDSDLDQLAIIIRTCGPVPERMVQTFQRNPLYRRVAFPHSSRGVQRSLRQRYAAQSAEWIQFLEACLHTDPADRPSCAELMELPYFTKDNFREEYEKELQMLVAASPYALLPPSALEAVELTGPDAAETAPADPKLESGAAAATSAASEQPSVLPLPQLPIAANGNSALLSPLAPAAAPDAIPADSNACAIPLPQLGQLWSQQLTSHGDLSTLASTQPARRHSPDPSPPRQQTQRQTNAAADAGSSSSGTATLPAILAGSAGLLTSCNSVGASGAQANAKQKGGDAAPALANATSPVKSAFTTPAKAEAAGAGERVPATPLGAVAASTVPVSSKHTAASAGRRGSSASPQPDKTGGAAPAEAAPPPAAAAATSPSKGAKRKANAGLAGRRNSSRSIGKDQEKVDRASRRPSLTRATDSSPPAVPRSQAGAQRSAHSSTLAQPLAAGVPKDRSDSYEGEAEDDGGGGVTSVSATSSTTTPRHGATSAASEAHRMSAAVRQESTKRAVAALSALTGGSRAGSAEHSTGPREDPPPSDSTGRKRLPSFRRDVPSVAAKDRGDAPAAAGPAGQLSNKPHMTVKLKKLRKREASSSTGAIPAKTASPAAQTTTVSKATRRTGADGVAGANAPATSALHTLPSPRKHKRISNPLAYNPGSSNSNGSGASHQPVPKQGAYNGGTGGARGRDGAAPAPDSVPQQHFYHLSVGGDVRGKRRAEEPTRAEGGDGKDTMTEMARVKGAPSGHPGDTADGLHSYYYRHMLGLKHYSTSTHSNGTLTNSVNGPRGAGGAGAGTSKELYLPPHALAALTLGGGGGDGEGKGGGMSEEHTPPALSLTPVLPQLLCARGGAGGSTSQ